MICPRLRSTIPGTIKRVIASKALMLVSITISHSSRLPSCSLSMPITNPALFTSISMGCHSSGNDSKATIAALRSRTSKGSKYTFTPYCFSNSSFNPFSLSTLRAFKIKLAPCEANLRAHPAPIPLEAPVIKTILSIYLFLFIKELTEIHTSNSSSPSKDLPDVKVQYNLQFSCIFFPLSLLP